MTRQVLVLAVVVLASVLVAGPSGAQTARIIVDPPIPHADESFRLVFGGHFDTRLGGLPEVQIEDGVIQVIRDARGGILTLDTSYAFEVEVGPLPWDVYRVELLFRIGTEPGTGGTDLYLAGARDVYIEPATSIDVQPVDAFFPAGYFLEGSRQLRFVARVFAAAASIDPTIQVLPAERRIDVPFGRSNLLSPPPYLMEIDRIETVDLEPGEWTVRLVEAGRVRATRTIEVLPFPVTLRDGRFEVAVDWSNLDTLSAAAPVAPPSEDSALFWFFEPTNWELMLKVLDGCAINGHYWVFGAAQTDRGYRIRVRDTLTDETWEAENLAGTPSPAITDTTAFATCP